MDIATIVGMILGTVLVLLSIGPENLQYFINVPSLVMVMGGTSAAILINYPLSTVLQVMGVLGKTMKAKPINLNEIIDQMVEFATVARRDGLLALEEKLQSLEDPFMLRGTQMIIDGVAPESVRAILTIELEQMAQRHAYGKGVVDNLGAFLPAFGMIGTLVGLVLMLQNLDDPSALGPGMAVALITTFYGALFANLFMIPLSGKLAARNTEEILSREIMIEGVLAIQTGESPNVIKERLMGFLPPKQRGGGEEDGG